MYIDIDNGVEKEYFTHNDFEECVSIIERQIKLERKDVHLVTLYRGGLPLGVRLSNSLNLPLSILKYQRYDAHDNDVQMMHNEGISSSDTIYLIDDIADEGISITKSLEYLHDKYPNNKVQVFTLIGKESHPKEWKYVLEHSGRWIVFETWEGK